MLVAGVESLYVSVEPTDFRKSYDGLAGLVLNELRRLPSDGSLYVFFNKRRDQIKVLYFQNGGYCIWQKRLELGSFANLSSGAGQSVLAISMTELLMILDGIELDRGRKRKRFRQKVGKTI